MPYLIDGHNLIPKLGLRLDSFDDEENLIARLQEFCRLNRTQVEVFFDGAAAGTPPTQKAGAVTCHFVRRGSTTVRTPDDDDGIMVLRFGPSASIDLTAPISCDARSGDDWVEGAVDVQVCE